MTPSVDGRTEGGVSELPQSPPKKIDLFSRLVGEANESLVTVCGVETKGLIDSGSMVTSVSESFYRSLEPQPELHELSEFGLTVKSATDTELPFIGCIEADISVPFLSNFDIAYHYLLYLTSITM